MEKIVWSAARMVVLSMSKYSDRTVGQIMLLLCKERQQQRQRRQ